jgi:uncharacterized protein (DUF58 family)
MTLNISQIKQFENLELLAKELVEGFITGLHRSPYHGFSVEFAEHKLYNYGESTKNIDWKVYARTDRLYTKQYEEETNLRCNILLDISPSMFFPEKTHDKLRFSLYSAAALSYLMVKQRDAVGIVSFADEIIYHSQIKSTKVHLNNLLIELDRLLKLKSPPVNSVSNISDTIHQIAKKIHKRSLVIIFTDLFQQSESLSPVFEALQHLKHNKHEILLFHVSDFNLEKNFSFKERPYRFVDLETGEKMNITPNQIKETYLAKINEFYNAIKLGCGKLKIDIVEVDTNQPFDKILSSYLTKRQKMK